MKTFSLPFALGLVALCAAQSLHGQIFFNGAAGAALPGGTTNVGIGVQTPLDKLDVSPTIRISRTGSPGNFMTLSTPGAYHSITTTNNLGFVINNGGQINYTLGGAVRTTMLSNGSIGVGTTTPNHKFHVHDGAMMVSGANAMGGAMIVFSDNPAPAAYPNGRHGIEYVPNVGLNFWQPWNPTPGGGANWNMLIKDDGKVGVGIDPGVPSNFPNGYRLYVKEGILTEKLKVATLGTAAWSDYVFDEDYKRNTLAEVEAFVKSNHHLPNVPSAAEVSAEGIDMVEMDATLLRQIEEIWLHMIDLEKENQALRTQIDQLR
jgi:hypothetical protein